MSLHSLKPLSYAASPTVLGLPITDFFNLYTPTGDPDGGICLRDLGDGKTIDSTVGDSFGLDTAVGTWPVYWDDDGVIPLNATINSIQFVVHHTGNAQILFPSPFGFGTTYISPPVGATALIDMDFRSAIASSAILTINPVTLVAWQRVDLFNDGDAGAQGKGLFYSLFLYNGVGFTDVFDQFELIVDYVGVTVDSAFPTQGGRLGGASVAINGSEFANAGVLTNVFFDGVPATSIFVINDNVIICRTPVHVPGFVNVVVEFDGSDQTSSTSPIFEYLQDQSFTPILENTSPARVGDKIIINSTLASLAFMGGTIQIQLSYPGHLITLVLGSGSQDPYLIVDDVIYYWINLVFIQTDFQMQFYLPFGFGRYAGPVTITLIGNGTQFSGSVLAGVLNVLYADASGIYSLTEGQTNDTLYFRDGYTTDIKFLFLNSENEIYDDNYFSMKQERLRMLAMNDFEYEDYEDYEDNFFTITGALRIPVTTIETEIPSPFVMTAFLP